MATIPNSDSVENNGLTTGERDATGRFLPGNSQGFKPGQTGNPNGRPLTLTEVLRRKLREADPYKPEQSVADTIVDGLLHEARVTRNIAAIREVWDRLEGKARQPVDMEMNVHDWRTVAQSHGLTDADVIEEARQLLNESVDTRSDRAGDTETESPGE